MIWNVVPWPTTLVIDRQGRVNGLILKPLDGDRVLTIDDQAKRRGEPPSDLITVLNIIATSNIKLRNISVAKGHNIDFTPEMK